MKKISLKNKRVFVAGHNGLVGKSLCKKLELEKSKLLVVDKKTLDLRDRNKTNIWLKSNKPDYIFIAAARVGGILENSLFPADFIYDNLSIVTNLIHLSYKNNVKKVLIYPKKSKAMNLAFDITPAKYVTGFITEKGVCEASSEGLKGLFK